MADPASSSPPKDVGTFASLLASLAGSVQHTSPSWDDSALADDVATISYEQALRSNRRVPLPASQSAASPVQASSSARAATATKTRKTASITIRVTEAEETQLHERAAAAQLSVSAYLRSCIFEAESLRAQVKEALSQMKAATAVCSHVSDEPLSKSTSGWRAHLIPRWSRHHTSA